SEPSPELRRRPLEPEPRLPDAPAVTAPVWTLAGVEFELCPERAAFRRDRAELLLSDVHLGKAATFRRAGRPIPRGTTTSELARVDRLVERTGARRIAILGDLFHADVEPESPTARRFEEWLAHRSQTVELVLVRGNHDRHAEDFLARLPLRVEDEPWTPAPGPAYRHHPIPDPANADPDPWIAGHLHPGVRLDDGTDRVKLPAFWSRGETLVLPSFGSFTGAHPVDARPGDRLGAITPTGVIEVPASLTTG
ncbi:MAG: ligase-associated DNA damage response endonuclease PdeM, partial [Planctomycetota bacterium]